MSLLNVMLRWDTVAHELKVTVPRWISWQAEWYRRLVGQQSKIFISCQNLLLLKNTRLLKSKTATKKESVKRPIKSCVYTL